MLVFTTSVDIVDIKECIWVVLDLLINISVVCPVRWLIKLVAGHEFLNGLSGTIVLPEFEAALHVVESLLPIARDIRFEGLAKDWAELLNVLL